MENGDPNNNGLETADVTSRIFLGPHGGLVAAFRSRVPVRLSLKTTADLIELRRCLAEDFDVAGSAAVATTQRSFHSICRPGVVGTVPLFPGGVVECCGAGSCGASSTDLVAPFSDLAAEAEGGESGNDSEAELSELPVGTFTLHPGSAVAFDAGWLQLGSLFDQRLAAIEDEVERWVGGADALDLAGQPHTGPVGESPVVSLLEWLRRHGLSVRALDMSRCYIADSCAYALAKELKQWPWLRSLGLAENVMTRSGITAILDAAHFRRRKESPLLLDMTYNAIGAPALGSSVGDVGDALHAVLVNGDVDGSGGAPVGGVGDVGDSVVNAFPVKLITAMV